MTTTTTTVITDALALAESQNIDTDALTAYIEDVLGTTYASNYTDADALLDSFNEAYQGQHDSLADYAEQLLADSGILRDVPDTLRAYIDYEAYGKDMELSGDVTCVSGYVFRTDC